ncbi:mitochondrial proton/calcium exchanger protein-like [Oscarella lobularis]|uniref:mitochondrial proton/calcium exchanger protein-like n=1 Tax=Oscarella lobularis TaxID=121494 RepID=UPI0033141744
MYRCVRLTFRYSRLFVVPIRPIDSVRPDFQLVRCLRPQIIRFCASSSPESSPKSRKDSEKSEQIVKPSIWQRIKGEALHYYSGFKLLYYDVKISSRFLLKSMRGETLTRRERKQFIRTASDLFRLVPFSVFIVVPFMEFLLPVALALFPNMLPSTFEKKSGKEKRKKSELKVKLEMAKFLQETIQEMAVAKTKKKDPVVKEFARFFENIRDSGEQASTKDLLKFSKLFEDELTLDNLSRPQLVALCKLLLLQPVGTNNFLRFQLRMKLRQLEADDKLIQNEGIDSLSTAELQGANQARGMRAIGVPKARLQSQLNQWLDLHLKEQVPASLLLLSRALYLPENVPTTDHLQATLSSLPQDMVGEAQIKAAEQEGERVHNKQRLDVLKKEEEKIVQEKAEELKQKQKKEAQAEEIKDVAPVMTSSTGVETTATTTPSPAPQPDEEISKEELLDIAEVVVSLKEPLAEEKETLEELKDELEKTKAKEDETIEVALSEEEEVKKGAARLEKRVKKMVSQIDTAMKEMKENLAEEESQIDCVVTTEQLADALKTLKKMPSETKVRRICEVLDDDSDGSIKVDDVLDAVEMIAKEDTDLKPEHISAVMDLLKKEKTTAEIKQS